MSTRKCRSADFPGDAKETVEVSREGTGFLFGLGNMGAPRMYANIKLPFVKIYA